jgi:hypothetical protein
MKNDFTSTREAYLDALSVKAGVSKLSSPGIHPDAVGIIDRSEHILKQIALGCALNHPHGKHGISSPGSVLALGLSTSDFVSALSSTLRKATIRALLASSEHRLFCKTFDMPNFLPQEFPNIDIDLNLTENPESAEATYNVNIVTTAGVNAKVRGFGRNVNISRSVILNDDIQLIAGVFTSAGNAASRLESALVYALIEQNPTLGDGMAMFHASHANIEFTALDETSLGVAIARLRNMITPSGATTNMAAKYLVVSPSLEMPAKKLVYQSNLGLTVIAASWLPAGRWYLIADPELSPCIGLLYLRGSSTGIVIGPRDTGAQDSTGLAIRFDVGVAPVGRVGIIRGGAL